MINSVLLLFAVTASQTHTPSATVSGDIVTVDADIAFLPSVGDQATELEERELLQGVNLGSPSGVMVKSADGVSPIVWRLPPGEYQIMSYGFPDQPRGFRNGAMLTVIVQAPDRADQIAAALQKLTLALFDAGQAQAELQTLNPTRQELIDALTQGAP